MRNQHPAHPQQHQPAQPASSLTNPHTYALQAGHDARFAQTNYEQAPKNDMAKLEALVAVATSENRAVEHRS